MRLELTRRQATQHEQNAAKRSLGYVVESRVTGSDWVVVAAFNFEECANRYADAMKAAYPMSSVEYRLTGYYK